jgi:hypothetical protein
MMNIITKHIDNPTSFNYPIFDFHCHYAPKIENYLRTYQIKGIALMPSWRTLDHSMKNDFVDIPAYLDKTLGATSQLRNFKIAEEITPVIPIDFTQPPQNLRMNLDHIQPAGIKLHPLQEFPIDPSFLDPYFTIIRQEHLFVYVHTDWVPSTEFGKYRITLNENFGHLAKFYPDIPFIMGHSGNSDSWVNIWKLMKKYPNTLCESSMAPSSGELEKVITKLGIDRVLFGSNFPFCSPAVEITKIHLMPGLTRKDREQILYENGSKLCKKSRGRYNDRV